jgi:hypothetical protein
MTIAEVRRVAYWSNRGNEAKQVVGGCAVAVDGLYRGAQHLLVMLEPLLPQIGDRNGLEAQRRGGADFQLRVDLGGQLPGCFAVKSDARAAALAILVVAEIPNLAAEVALHAADAERRSFSGHGPRQRSFPPQNATNTATNGKLRGLLRKAKADESGTYDSSASRQAERAGFEPSLALLPRRFSRPAHHLKKTLQNKAFPQHRANSRRRAYAGAYAYSAPRSDIQPPLLLVSCFHRMIRRPS